MSLQHRIQKSANPKASDISEHVKPSAGSKQLKAAGAESAMSPAHIMQLQRTVGNQAVQRMLANQNTPLQREALSEEELQMKADPNAIQREESAEDETEELQMKADPNKMPEKVQSKMENAFGADFSDVRVHEGNKASDVGAHAYAQGSDIHFAPGQYDPESQSGQELLGHELTHVVQQRQGEVKPTTQVNGVAVNDDPGLENEADQMGKKAASQPEQDI
ncbi:unnamed protein product [Aphanomyces euteiches]